MEPFVMEIAGTAFAVESLFESTKAYCRDYLTDSMAECSVSVTKADLLVEQKLLDLEADEKGIKRRKFSEPFLERSVIQRKIAEVLAQKGVLLLHGSTVAVDGKAYLFTAACGTGKSTHTRLWREVFGDRAVMVNDDKPFLRLEDGVVTACGSPWTGKHGLGENVTVPLKGICILKRGAENRIYSITADDARAMLQHQCFQPEHEPMVVYNTLEQVMELVPLWEMECTREPTAALIAHKAMSNV